MIKISKKVEYALIILKYLKENQKTEGSDEGARAQAREIRERFSIPFDTASKVMQELHRASVLKSYQGVKGGYSLEQDLERVSFFDLHRILEGPNTASGHFCEANPRSKNCEVYDTCIIKGPLSKLNQRLVEFYKNISLHELLSPAADDIVPLARSPFELEGKSKKTPSQNTNANNENSSSQDKVRQS